jgi:hypothetical protein
MKALNAAFAGIPFAGLLLLASSPASAATGTCDVTVNRTYANGTYEVTKQVMPNKDCICYIQTGSEPQDTGIEQRITAVRKSRRCDDAVVMAIPPGSQAVPGAVAGIAGMKILPALAAMAAAGAGIAAIDSSNDSPASP